MPTQGDAAPAAAPSTAREPSGPEAETASLPARADIHVCEKEEGGSFRAGKADAMPDMAPMPARGLDGLLGGTAGDESRREIFTGSQKSVEAQRDLGGVVRWRLCNSLYGGRHRHGGVARVERGAGII